MDYDAQIAPLGDDEPCRFPYEHITFVAEAFAPADQNQIPTRAKYRAPSRRPR